ncbi:hypothetical protein ACQ4LE_010814, partial [Meloidogyne hapla]
MTEHRPFGNNSVLPGSTILLKFILTLKNKNEENNDFLTILKNICFLKPIIFNENEGDVVLGCKKNFNKSNKDKSEFKICLQHNKNQNKNVFIVEIIRNPNNNQNNNQNLPEPPKSPFPYKVLHKDFYQFLMEECGYNFGKSFKSVKSVNYCIGFEMGKFMAWGCCEVIQKVEELDIKLDALWQAMVYCYLKETGNKKLAEHQQQHLLVPFSIGKLFIGPKLFKNESEDKRPIKMNFSIHLNEDMAIGNFWIEEKGEILMFGEDLLFRMLDEKSFGEMNKTKMEINKGIIIEEKQKKDLAVIISSIACRLPGNVNCPDQFWKLLKEGRSTNQRIPATRVAERNSLIRGEFNGGNVPVEGGHFLDFDLALFDANFFGLSALEASALDPQQRLLLECAWECVELSENNSPKQLEQCGVFIGFMSNEYQELTDQQGNALQMLGTTASAFSGRLAHFLDCRGPTLSIDTACSSSLVALQLAVEAIRSGRCPRAIVGGVNLTLTAKGLAHRANAGMLSEDGCCRVFDADAIGYGRSDGCVVMMIEGVLSEKLETIPHWGVIEAVECGHDGRSAALTAPNGLSQQLLLARCLERLNIEQKHSLCCWECHGTGTALGDPVEFLALAKALTTAGITKSVWLGSAKANIGHTEAASGLVGVLKAVLQLKHAEMPPLPHFKRINPEIVRGMEANGWGGYEKNNWPVRLATKKAERLSEGEDRHTLLAGVSSFGVSGTLACAIISLNRSIQPKQIKLPKYSFDRQKRFWTLKDDWKLNINDGCHPLLGNCINRGKDFVKFESLLCTKRMPWLISKSPNNSSSNCHIIGLLIELLTAIGYLNLKLSCFSIQFEEIYVKEFLNKKERQWIISDIFKS